MLILLLIIQTLFTTVTSQELTGCLLHNQNKTNECSYCKPGYGFNSESKNCTICPKGQYSPGGTNSCNFCFNYNHCKEITDENERKIKCPYYSSSEGSSSCEICSINKFVNEDHTKCMDCMENCMDVHL